MRRQCCLLWCVLCSVAIASVAADKLTYVKVDTPSQMFVDTYGRTVVFHGVNAVYKEPPYYPITDSFDPQLSLCEEDMENMVKWGINVVRLGVMWQGVAPIKGQIDTDYLAKMAEIIQNLASHGIYTLIDLHQDLLSDLLCGEGAPDWAVYIPTGTAPFPSPVNVSLEFDPVTGYPTIDSCLQLVFGIYYFSEAVSAAFQSLFSNTNGVQDSFIDYWSAVSQYFANVDGVLGYEIINEPWAGDIYRDVTLLLPTIADKKNLAPLYARANDAIRQHDNYHLVFFEKSMTNILGPTGFTSGPGGASYNDRQVYSYHNYCGDVDDDGDPRSVLVCDGEESVEWEQEMLDVKNLGCGSMMTEFGAMGGNNTKTVGALNNLLYHADNRKQSWMYWQFKAYQDITTVSNDAESFYWNDGTLQDDKVKALTRTYPQAVAGSIDSYNFDPSSGKFTLFFNMDTSISQPTIIYANIEMYYPDGVEVSLYPLNVASYTVNGNYITIKPLSTTATGTALQVTVMNAL